MEIMYFRKLKNTDDIDEIAEWIYSTEEFLCNILFKDKIQSITALGRLIQRQHINPYHKSFITLICDDETDQPMGVSVSFKGSQISSKETYKAFVETSCSNTFLIMGGLIGCEFFASKIGTKDYYIGNLYVDEKHRHKHLGSKLVNKEKANASYLNCENVLLDVEYDKSYLLDFYGKLGFVEDSKNYHEVMGKTYGCYGLKYSLRD